MVEDDQTLLVIDSGPDFRQQLLRVGAKKLDGLVFTHEHKDHIAGMDDIRAFNYVLKKAVDVYATKQVQKALEREFHYVFNNELKYPGIPELVMHTIENKKFNVGTIELEPVLVKHFMLDVFGFRIGGFTYITDAKTIPDFEIEKIKDSDVLVLNALRREDHISHFTLEEAVEMSIRVGAKKTYLTHISHQLGTNAEISKELPDGVELAYDGLVINL